MIRKILFLLPMLLLAAPAFADSQGSATGGTAGTQSTAAGCIYNSSQPTLVTGQQVTLQCDVNGNVRTTGGGGGGGNVNLTGINGVTPLAGTGATGTGSLRTTQAQDANTVAGAAPTTTGIFVTGPSAAALSTSANQSSQITQETATAAVSGTTSDTAYAGSGNSTINAGIRGIYNAATSPIPAGTNLIGKVGIDQTTPGTTNGVQVNAALPAGTNLLGKTGIDQTTPGTTNGVSPVAAATGGATPFTLTLANSTNATNVKNAAGTLYHIAVYGVTATPAWLSLYNNAGTPTCGTGIVYQVLIPANSTSGAGAVEDFGNGMNFSTGIAYCVTTGIAGTGSVAANSGVVGGTFK